MSERFWGPFAAWRAANPQPDELGFYEGFFAGFYDRTTFGDTSGAEHYLRLAEAHSGPLLEPLCGTGRVLLRLAHHGHEVVGLDSSGDVVRLLMQRVSLLPEETRDRVSVYQGDARDFDLEQRFALVIVPANSIALLDEACDRVRFLRCARRHLDDEGSIAFDYISVDDHVAAAADGQLETLSETVDGVTFVSTFGIRFGPNRGIFNISTTELRQGELPRQRVGTFSFSRMDHLEVEDALEQAGLEIVDRAMSPDVLAGQQVIRCSLTVRACVRHSYPLWHPHLPMNDVEEAATVLVEGNGVHVRDREGKEYIDAAGGLWSTNLGLGRVEVVDAVTRQLEKLSYGTLFALRSNEPAIELSRLLIDITPTALTRVYLTCSGSESVELAIKLARLYHSVRGQNQRTSVLHLDRSYHGTYYGSMGVTALHPLKERLGPGVRGLVPVPAPPPQGEGDYHSSIDALERAIVATEGGVAAFIFEPVLGSAGCIVPDPGWFRDVAETCRRHDVLLLADEVATGFGRTGRWFACEHFDVRPDMLLLSKGINSGYLPLGAVVFTERLADTLLRAGVGIGHGSSANGNPACCAAGIATIEVLRRERLVERAAALGGRLEAGLKELLNLPLVRNVRGIGLMWAIELNVADGAEGALDVGRIMLALQSAGVLAYPFERGISLFPALTIDPHDLDEIVDRIASCVELPAPVGP